MPKSLGFEIVAEDGEKQEELDFLEKPECDYYQVHMFSKPRPKLECDH